MFPQFLHLVDNRALRLVLLALYPALCLVALFLLSRLFLLAFSKRRSSSWHSQFLPGFIACVAGSHTHASSCLPKTRKLPARFARLACVSLIIVPASSATAATATTAAAKSLPATASTTAPRTVCLWLRLIDLQSASTKLRSVQCRDCFISFSGIRHFHKSESASASRFAVGHDAYFFHRAVCFKHRPQLGLGCAVGQITYIQILHRISSLNHSLTANNSVAINGTIRPSPASTQNSRLPSPVAPHSSAATDYAYALRCSVGVRG
jgi:hypothetical protein